MTSERAALETRRGTITQALEQEAASLSTAEVVSIRQAAISYVSNTSSGYPRFAAESTATNYVAYQSQRVVDPQQALATLVGTGKLVAGIAQYGSDKQFSVPTAGCTTITTIAQLRTFLRLATAWRLDGRGRTRPGLCYANRHGRNHLREDHRRHHSLAQNLRGRARPRFPRRRSAIAGAHAGHPKEPAVTLDELSDEAAAALGRVMPRICRAVKQVTGCSGYNVLQNNGSIAHQVVMHVHFHIIPKPDDAQGLGIDWPTKPVDHDDARKLAAELATAARG